MWNRFNNPKGAVLDRELMQCSHVKEVNLYSIVYLYAVDIPRNVTHLVDAAHNISDWRGMLWRTLRGVASNVVSFHVDFQLQPNSGIRHPNAAKNVSLHHYTITVHISQDASMLFCCLCHFLTLQSKCAPLQNTLVMVFWLATATFLPSKQSSHSPLTSTRQIQ